MPFRIENAASEADPEFFSGGRGITARPSVVALAAPPRAGDESGDVVDVAFEPVTVFSAAPANDRAPADAIADVILTLQTEQRAANGGRDHPHAASDCPFCRRAVAFYRS